MRKSNGTPHRSSAEPDSSVKDEKNRRLHRVLDWVNQGAQQTLDIAAIDRVSAKDLEADLSSLGINLR
jgi:hypothetical protein